MLSHLAAAHVALLGLLPSLLLLQLLHLVLHLLLLLVVHAHANLVEQRTHTCHAAAGVT